MLLCLTVSLANKRLKMLMEPILCCQFMEVIDKIGAQISLEGLLSILNDQGYSDYLVVYLR